MLLTSTLFALSATMASATNLWIADYGGTITTAELTESGGNYALEKTFSTDKCGPSPSWLTIDTNRGLMFCSNEGLNAAGVNPNGSIASFTINADASLNPVTNQTTIVGPVNALIYGNPTGQRGLVAAHYTGSAVTTFKLLGQGQLEAHQEFIFTGNGPEENQDSPHPHEAIMDPTGQYILVPDLGLDVVHIFSWDADTLELKELDPLKVDPGTGPRHAVFYNPSGLACESCTTYMYLVGELGADVTGFDVTYKKTGMGMDFKNVTYSLTQPGNPANAPAEVQLSPDGRFIIVSNRDVTDDGTEFQDTSTNSSLATFCIHEEGQLEGPYLTTSDLIGHGYPRHFSMNKYGNLVAVGLQNTNQAIILPRNTSSGVIDSEPVAKIALTGNVTNVMWDE